MTEAGTLVLLYHRVAHLERDPYGLAVHPDRFAEQCRVLRNRCDVVPLSETHGHTPQVVITFDDGYADNGREARAILQAAGLPATFFITAGRLGDRSEVWWDRLEQICLGCEPRVDHIDLEIAGRRFWGDLRSPAARARVHVALYWRLRPLRPTAIASTLAVLIDQLGVEPAARDTHRWMTVDELRALAATDGIDVGAHTLTHPVLAALPEDDQRVEIDASRSELERMLNRPVRLFSYPYGGRDTFDDVTTRLVRESGFEAACTTAGGMAGPAHYPYAIPRNVVGDWDGAAFEQWLAQNSRSATLRS